MTIGDGAVSSARIVVGETPHLGTRLRPVEALLVGSSLDTAAIENAAELARSTVDAGTDLRASAPYRRQLASVAVKRCLTAIGHRLGTLPS